MLTDDCPEVKVSQGKFSAVNTVFENDAANYLPFVGASGTSMALSHSFVRNFKTANFNVGTAGFTESVVSQGVSVAVSPARKGDFAFKTADPAIQPRGRNVWFVGNVPYAYDKGNAKPWLNVRDLTRSASVSGLTLQSPLPDDALGNPRRLGHRPLQGPVAVKLGFMLLVR